MLFGSVWVLIPTCTAYAKMDEMRAISGTVRTLIFLFFWTFFLSIFDKKGLWEISHYVDYEKRKNKS